MTEVHTERGKNFETVRANNKYCIVATAAYNRSKAIKAKIEALNSQVQHVQNTLDAESMNAKYGPDSGFEARAKALEQEYQAARNEMNSYNDDINKFQAEFV